MIVTTEEKAFDPTVSVVSDRDPGVRQWSLVMRSSKQYTDQTFTKRVDHDKGEHRQPIGHKEPVVCTQCGAVYRHRHWSVAIGEPTIGSRALCPACRQIRQGIVGGYVTVGGEFAEAHRGEIERLIANEAERALENDPLSRIQRSAWKNGGLKIETTTEHLAARLGKALACAYKGELRFDFSHENKVIRVNWRRS